MGKKPTTRGRPKSEDPIRNKRLAIRVTDSEKEFFERAAADARRDTSDWARLILEAAARKQLGE